ncbi:hypothetical protein BG015_003986 [Linnemannia schmuckeri]|uniref:Cas12f1-like TNB domain-containing protein n=1 Tax=Linnemannia schmuckeri TaxID=64567 RepID=A0A9P5RFE9_9FUNG|nr:hypothetical protein BG015_003986 [Linnemannia schmuckeri]
MRNHYKKHDWDLERAKHAEYQILAEGLLNVVGSLGRRIEDNKDKDPILIGVGLGQFSSNSKLSSLHSTFLSYFIRMVRSLGYVVVGINEYYTLKKCSRCTGFIAQVTLRRFYCYGCKRYYHRDVMAAQNMCEIVLHRLKNFEIGNRLQQMEHTRGWQVPARFRAPRRQAAPALPAAPRHIARGLSRIPVRIRAGGANRPESRLVFYACAKPRICDGLWGWVLRRLYFGNVI